MARKLEPKAIAGYHKIQTFKLNDCLQVSYFNEAIQDHIGIVVELDTVLVFFWRSSDTNRLGQGHREVQTPGNMEGDRVEHASLQLSALPFFPTGGSAWVTGASTRTL